MVVRGKRALARLSVQPNCMGVSLRKQTKTKPGAVNVELKSPPLRKPSNYGWVTTRTRFRGAHLRTEPGAFYQGNHRLCSAFDLSSAELHRKHVRGTKPWGIRLCLMKKKIICLTCLVSQMPRRIIKAERCFLDKNHSSLLPIREMDSRNNNRIKVFLSSSKFPRVQGKPLVVPRN